MFYEALAVRRHRTGKPAGDAPGFWRSDAGVTTVEWVALAGGLVIATVAISGILMYALGEVAVGIASQLSP